MIVVRTEAEMLQLLEGQKSQLRDDKGEFREPERCPYCESLMIPSLSKGGRPIRECLECEQED